MNIVPKNPEPFRVCHPLHDFLIHSKKSKITDCGTPDETFNLIEKSVGQVVDDQNDTS